MMTCKKEPGIEPGLETETLDGLAPVDLWAAQVRN